MIRTSTQGKRIESRLDRVALFEDPINFRIVSTNGRQEYFRAVNDVIVRHDITPNQFYGLNASRTEFSVPLPPQVPVTNRPFTKNDLLCDASYYGVARDALVGAVKNHTAETAVSLALGVAGNYAVPHIAAAAGAAASTIVTAASSAATAVNAVLFPPQAVTQGTTVLLNAGKSIGGRTVSKSGLRIGTAVTGGVVSGVTAGAIALGNETGNINRERSEDRYSDSSDSDDE